jgi:hypothetical protein
VANIDVNINVKLTNEQRIAKLEGELEKLRQTGNKSIVSFGTLAGALSAVVSAKLLVDIAQINLQFQQLGQKISIAAGSAEEGAKVLNQLRAYAKDSQLTVAELGNTFIRLKAAGIQPSTEILDLFSKAAESSTDKTGTLEAMTTLFSKAARGAGIDTKALNQLAMDGIPVFEILQKKLGLNAEQLLEFTKDGQNTLPVLTALKQGISELSNINIVNDLEKSFKNFKQATQDASVAIGEAGLNGAIVNLLDTISRLIAENQKAIHNIGVLLGGAINIATKAIELLNDHFVLFLGLGIAGAMILYATEIIKVATAIKNLTIATAALNAVMRANPILLIASGLIAAGAAIYDYTSSTDKAKTSNEGLNNSMGGVNTTASVYGGIFDQNTKQLGLFTDAQKQAYLSSKALDEQLAKNDAANYAAALQKKIDAAKGYLDQIRQMGMDENDKIFEQQKQHEEKLLKLKEESVITEAEYYEYLNQVYAEHNKKLIEEEYKKNKQMEDLRKQSLEAWKAGKYEEVNIQILTEEQKKEAIYTTAKSALELVAAQNEKAFRLMQAVSIAEAIINTYTGATKALAQGGILGPVMAAVVIAQGLAQVATIRAQKFPGREKGGPVVAGRPYMVGEAGPELFQPSTSGNIIPNNQLSANGDIVNINFNVSTVDAKGFDELLSSRRELIVNTVNEAMRERGMRGLTA